MQQVSQHKPTTLQLDKSFPEMSPTESYYLLNHETLLNINERFGSNAGKGKPLPANIKACDIDQPGGENYTIGGYRSSLTNELYSWHYNSNSVHYILRTSNEGCEVVYSGPCLFLDANPEHSIEIWRAYMRIEKVCPYRDGKYLIWTDGKNPIGYIDVEAAIATNFFTTPFFDICPDGCAVTQLCVPDPCGCIKAEFVPLSLSQIGLNNFIADKPLQFIYKHIYYDGRESIWSDPSSTFYETVRGCFENNTGASRCLKLRIPVGNPLVEKIAVGFTDNRQNWYITEIVEKYKKYNSSQDKWYNRELSEAVAPTFSDIDCSFDYIFCNDKERILIDPKELSRVRNPIPQLAQGILPVKDSIGFYNYIDGNCPIDKIETEKFEVALDCDPASDCIIEFATVTVRAIIHRINNRNQFIYRMNGTTTSVDDPADPAYFGGNGEDHAQVFTDKTRNFIPYVEATEYWGTMDQWKSDAFFTNTKKVGVLPDASTGATYNGYVNFVNNGGFYYQETKIKVPKGTRGFLRLASHHSTSGISGNQNTSTPVYGILSDIALYKGNLNITSITDTDEKEIYFDTCSGDVILDETFIIYDQGFDASYSGYIKDKDGFPVEGALLYRTGFPANLLATTDHNGFYYFNNVLTTISIDINVELSCATFATVQTMVLEGATSTHTSHDETITSDIYNDQFYLIVKMKVEDCNGGIVAGLRVAISGSKYRVTGSNGNALFRVRNYSTRDRSIRAVVMNVNGCFTADCNGVCNPCMPQSDGTAPVCFIGEPPQELTLATVTVNTASIGLERGLKAGGRYGVGIMVKGDCGKQSAVYPIGDGYINIPKTQDVGKLRFCDFSYNGNGITLPSWAKCLQIVRTINLNPYQLQWVVDKIERTENGNIKLTIQSLNDYNTRYFFQTNTVYQWFKGDRIEFIRNGDGTVFSVGANGILNYLTISPFHDELISGVTDAPADFFNQLLIQDDGRLNGLEEGAVIELQRPNSSTTENIYYGICASIEVKADGTLLNDTGVFSTFDTFIVNRTSGNFLGNFEHFSPSDFWGDPIIRISDTGKAYIQNQYETERRYGRNISINSPTIFNYFGDLVKTFNAPEQGDIIAMGIKDGQIIAAICQNDNFLAQSADELVRVGGDGIIRALPPDSIISDAEPKLFGAYGCQYPHIGSIYFGDGYFTWTDVNNNARVVHDYSSAKDVAKGRVQTYYRIRCQELETLNRNTTNPLDKYRFVTGFNTQTGMLFQTIKRLRDSGYNNEKKPFVIKNDTIMYHPTLNEWFGFASFTPEFYGNLDLFDATGCAFISYLSATPYIHPILSDKYNEFFGVPCDEIFWITVNQPARKMKEVLAMEIQSDMMWFSYEITNGKVNFISEIPAVKWKKDNDKWNAAFLFNKNSRAGLYGNGGGVPDTTRGWFINIAMIRDNTDALKYGTIDNAKRIVYNETDNIFVKFQIIEQTGFENNL